MSSARRSPEEKLAYAVLLSGLFHALLLSLTFGRYGWLPGFIFPWQDRPNAVSDLRVLLVPERITPAEPAVIAPPPSPRPRRVEQPVSKKPSPTPPVSDALVKEKLTTKKAQTKPKEKAAPEAAAIPPKDPVASPARAEPQSRADMRADSPPPIPTPEVIAVPKDEPTWVIPPPAENPTPAIAVTPSASSPQAVAQAAPDAADAARIESERLATERAEAARVEALRLEAEREAAARIETARAEAARLQAEREAAARLEAARLQAEREETARLQAQREETARLQAEREETARLQTQREETARLQAQREETARLQAQREEAAQLQAQREEAARLQAEREAAARLQAQEAARLQAEREAAARLEAARLQAEREAAARLQVQETARLQAEREAAARLQAQRDEAARIKAEQEQAAARREERLRALGRELDESAARRDAARQARAAGSPFPSHKPLRRHRLLGRTDPNPEAKAYGEAFGQKIELNMTIEMVREAAKERHDDPLVLVAIRSDGFVESVTFLRSSGVAAIDEAVRRIVASQEPYPMFPPALAREYDVIEIPRSWHFDVAVRLY
jgi:TolA protein